MFKFYARILAMWLCVSLAANAQSPTIGLNGDYYASICTNVPFRLSVTTTGSFNADNKFSVQMRAAENQVTLAEFPAVLSDGRLEFTLKDSVTYANRQVQFRAVASSPKTQSGWTYGTFVYSRGRIILNPTNQKDTINTFDNVSVPFSGTSVGDIRVTLNDSTKFSFYANPGGFSVTQPLTVRSANAVYTIAHAENICGAMEVTGRYQPVINAISVKTVGVAPNTVCENSEVKVTFSTAGTSFDAQTRYRIRFSETYWQSSRRSVEAPATLQGNYLVATFPDKLKLQSGQQFSVQVITDSPATVSTPSQNTITVWPKTSATFATSSQTTDIGNSVYLNVKAYGLPPFLVELTDGSKVTGNSTDLGFHVSPSSNQNYSIKSVTSGCGTVNITDQEVLQIKVRPGIRFATDPNTSLIACAGPNTRVKFASSAQLTDATTYKIKVSPSNGNNYYVNANRSGEYLEFPLSTSVSYSNTSFQIVTTNPSLESNYTYNLIIQTPPKIKYYANSMSGTVLDIPGRLSVSYNMDGGAPYRIEEMDGTVKTVDTWYTNGPELFVKQPTQYKIKSIANDCFKNENPGSVTFTVKNATEPGIYIEPIKATICNGDSIEVVFGTVGQFGAGNKFTIQTNQPCCDFKPLRVVEQGGKYKVKIPAEASYNYEGEIRIASSNPVLFSNVERTRIQIPAKDFYVYPDTKPEEPYKYVASDAGVSLSVGVNTSLLSMIYTENDLEKSYTFEPYSYGLMVKPKPGATTTYEIKSVTNECGTFPVNKKTYIRAMPNRIQFTSGLASVYCAGSPLALPFSITEGMDTGASYSLEIAPGNTSDFTPLVTGEKGKQFNTNIPQDFATGSYLLRIVSSDGSISEPQGTQISGPPTATLSPDNGQSNPVKIEAGQSLTLRIRTEGASPVTAIFSDNSRQDFYSSDQSWYVTPARSQQYSIVSVSNACGYGTASGKVDVTVNPRLNASAQSTAVCEGGSITVNYELIGDADLSDSYVRFSIKEQSSDGKTIALDSTRALKGSVTLKLPDALTGSYYAIVCSVAKYSLSTTLGVGVTTKPSVTLSGNTTINSGESTQLIIQTNKYTSDMARYTLSDGTSGSIYGSPGSGTYVTVTPTKTTTYTITSIVNGCGNGVVSGSATVEVNPPSERTVTVTSIITKSGFNACTGDTIGVDYKTAGSFSAGNTFTVQISDSTGKNFRNITTIGNAKPIQAIVPGDLSPTAQYRIRVIASDPNTGSGAFGAPLVAMQKARARFASETVIFDGVNNPKITVLLGGGGPWYYQFGTDGSVMNRQAYTSTDVVELFQASPSQYYRLFRVSNGCGAGIIESPSTVKVEVVTATEPNTPSFQVTVAPNPVQDILTVKSESSDEKTIQLISQNGSLVRAVKTRLREEQLDIRNLSPGVYLLHVNAKGRKATFKVIKQ
ncbi:Por secretion system C-terminal sorting domain-containing protein [Dyadobacter sp. SG02]|uniref:T9SS type A sorting domain-containing protein n=1 Tax=Dyadobacter sp. SG02 TaxID=1855291 RepID=UPI0008D5AFD5|nr:T9SS type A sorting domain-containing protein [Dyadobacter sp. SG02]SEJ13434.1 Por secretion system C-terminal sorting domain-containing protein [Dyadobacter sp. SG02]